MIFKRWQRRKLHGALVVVRQLKALGLPLLANIMRETLRGNLSPMRQLHDTLRL